MDKLLIISSDILKKIGKSNYNKCFFDAIIYFNYPDYVSQFNPSSMYQVLTDYTMTNITGNELINSSKNFHGDMQYIREFMSSAKSNAKIMWKNILSHKTQTSLFYGECLQSYGLDELFIEHANTCNDDDTYRLLYNYITNNTLYSETRIPIIRKFIGCNIFSEKEKDMILLGNFDMYDHPYADKLIGLYEKYINEIPNLKYLLARECVYNRSTYYDNDDITKILLEYIDENNKYRENNKYSYDKLPILNNTQYYTFDAEYELLVMHIENRTKVWNDEECAKVIDKHMKGFSKPEKYVTLKEKMFIMNRGEDPRYLTIANNSSNFTISFMMNNDIIILLPKERHTERNMREKGISRINLHIIIMENNLTLCDTKSIETNIYVACYGNIKTPKIDIYFEPDASEDSINPTSEMIRQVAEILQKEYEIQKRDYPSMNLDNFVRTLDCETIGSGHMQNVFAQKLNCLMRPAQLTKALQIILGDA